MIRPPYTFARRGRATSRVVALLAALCGLLCPMASHAGTPTLTTIAIDGNMGDWSVVLADPDNVALDGPAGGLPDADSPSQSMLDLDTFAFTWDAANLYLYLHRQGNTKSIRYYWFYMDLDDDGLMETGEPVLEMTWWGSNKRLGLRLDTYVASSPAGDPITVAGSHDGNSLPGRVVWGAQLGTLYSVSADGLAGEVALSWAILGVPAGSGMEIHLSSTRRLSDAPDVSDNVGRNNYFAGVTLNPDRSVSTTPGVTAVMAHTLTNTGNRADLFQMTWSVTGSFTPTSVTLYRDTDGNGLLGAGDLPLVDTDGDGNPDTGPVAPLGGALPILLAVATPASASSGDTATLVLRATSAYDPAAFDEATDRIALDGPNLTLLKSADKSQATPGETVTYTVTYTNTGNSEAQNVVLTDQAPAPALYVAGSATGPGMSITWSHDGGGTFDGSEAAPVTHIRWTLAGSLVPSASGSVTFTVLVP